MMACLHVICIFEFVSQDQPPSTWRISRRFLWAIIIRVHIHSLRFSKFVITLELIPIKEVIAFWEKWPYKGQHFRWGMWNTRISSRLPSLQLLLPLFFKKRLEKVTTEIFPLLPIDWPLISHFPSTSPSPPSSLYVTQLPVLYMWFLQAPFCQAK